MTKKSNKKLNGKVDVKVEVEQKKEESVSLDELMYKINTAFSLYQSGALSKKTILSMYHKYVGLSKGQNSYSCYMDSLALRMFQCGLIDKSELLKDCGYCAELEIDELMKQNVIVDELAKKKNLPLHGDPTDEQGNSITDSRLKISYLSDKLKEAFRRDDKDIVVEIVGETCLEKKLRIENRHNLTQEDIDNIDKKILSKNRQNLTQEDIDDIDRKALAKRNGSDNSRLLPDIIQEEFEKELLKCQTLPKISIFKKFLRFILFRKDKVVVKQESRREIFARVERKFQNNELLKSDAEINEQGHIVV